MPGRTTGDNKFGPGPYVVGPILGDGVNYDTIQSAVNAAAADGYPVVYVRPNTYSENVVFPAEVTLVGAEVDGRDAYVLINGNCTTSGNGVFSFRNIAFTAAAGDVFFSDAAGGVSSFRFNNCYVSGPAGVVGLAFDASGGQVFLALEDSSVIMNSNGINLTGGCQATIEGSTLESGIAVALSLTGTGNTAEVRDCKISAQNDDAISIGNNSGSVIISSSTLMAGVAGFDIGAGSSVQATHCTLEANNGAGFWVTGGGDFSYADMVLTGTALNIDTGSLNSVTALPWQQYAEAAAAGPGSVRGTASFNSADFTVVDGFVSAVGGGGGVSLSPYIVGTTGSSDFALIQDAIDAIVTNFGGNGNIYVKPGTYAENLDFTGITNLTLQSFNQLGDLTPINSGVVIPNQQTVINGNLTFPTFAGSIKIDGFRISNVGANPTFDVVGGINGLFVLNCDISSIPSVFDYDNGLLLQNVSVQSSSIVTLDRLFNIGDGVDFVFESDNSYISSSTQNIVGNATNFTMDTSNTTLSFRGVQGLNATTLNFYTKASYINCAITPILEGGAGTVVQLTSTNSFINAPTEFIIAPGAGSVVKASNSVLPYAYNSAPTVNGTIEISQCSTTRSGSYPVGAGGEEIFRSTLFHGGTAWTGAVSLRDQAALITNDGLLHVLFNVDASIIAPIGRSYAIRAKITCRNDVTEDAGSFFLEIAAKYHTVMGWQILPGAPLITSYTDAGFGVLVSVTAGAALDVNVTGIAGQVIYWFCDYELIDVAVDT